MEAENLGIKVMDEPVFVNTMPTRWKRQVSATYVPIAEASLKIRAAEHGW